MSRPTTCAPSRASVDGDRGADAARRAGDERDLAVERALPVGRRGRRRRRRCGRPGRRRRPTSATAGTAASTRSASSAPGPTQDELRGRAAARLLADRAGEALERALRAPRPVRAVAGGVPSTTTRPDGSTRRMVGAKNACSASSSSSVSMPVASKTSALNVASSPRSRVPDAASSPRRRPPAQVVAQLGGHLAPALARTAPGPAAARRARRRAAPRPRSPGRPASSARAGPASGSPTFLTTSLPIGELAIWV